MGPRSVLVPITGDPHPGSLGTLIGEVLAVLDQGDAAAALARLERGDGPPGDETAGGTRQIGWWSLRP